MTPARAACALSAVLPLACCSPSPSSLFVATESYITAVSLNDAARALAMSAPYQRELLAASSPEQKAAVGASYRGLIERGYLLWEEAKARGELSPDPLGVALIRAIGLGKEGAASLPLGVTFDDGAKRAVVSARAITNYDRITWENLPVGGRMYLMGYPFGRVVNFATGYDDPSRLQLLATVDLRWTLVRIPEVGRPEGAPGEWLVESVEAMEATATAWSPPPIPESP